MCYWFLTIMKNSVCFLRRRQRLIFVLSRQFMLLGRSPCRLVTAPFVLQAQSTPLQNRASLIYRVSYFKGFNIWVKDYRVFNWIKNRNKIVLIQLL
jgi:hypothetical protein